VWKKKIRQHFGDAVQVIKDLKLSNIDIVFIDADKKNNLRYFDLIFDKVRSGGLIIIDNVLWKGKVYGDDPDSYREDADTKSIRKLNDQVSADKRVEKLILPVRDGLLIIRKK